MLVIITILVGLIKTIDSEAPFSIDFTCSDKKFDISSLECSSCDNTLNESISLDQSSCLLCDIDSAIFNISINKCQCDSYNKYLSELEDKKICNQCPINHAVESLINNGDNYECILCEYPKIIDNNANNKCLCPSGFIETQLGKKCVSSSNLTYITNDYTLSASKEISYKNIDTLEIITIENSLLFDYYFLDSAINCKIYNDIKSCQILANLCVLTMYNKLHNSCKLFIEIVNNVNINSNSRYFTNWKQNLPFLFYSDNNILTSTSLSSSISINLNDKLTLILIKYSMNGTMIGYKEHEYELFYFCKDYININDQSKFTKIGYNTQIKCSYDLSKILNNNNNTNYDELIFYDPYLYISSQNKYYPLPIYINNINNDDGYKIVRRFFISDNFASNNQILIYLKSVKFKVNIYSENKNKIYPPLIEIEYGMIKISSDSSKVVSISFNGVYITDLTNFKISVIILFIITLILIILKWIYNIYRYQKIQLLQEKNTDLIWLVRIILIGFGVSSHLFFWYLFFISSYCYLSFKGQSNIKFLLPLDNDSILISFKGLLIYCFFAKLFHFLMLIYDQCNIDISFIDWEKPKGNIMKNTMQNYSISCWRKLFIANKWNQLSIYRNIDLSFIFLIFLLFMIGFEFESLSLKKPINSGSEQIIEISIIFKFVISTFFLMIIYFIKYLYFFFINDRFISSNPFIDLIDLSSLTNISIFILNNRYHGYYIHGKTIHQYSDISLQEIYKNIENEKNNLCKSRGLIPNQDVFEIFVSIQFREKYDEIYRDIYQNNDSNKLLSLFLSDFIEKSCPFKYEIKQNLIGFEKFFGPFPNLFIEKKSIFYQDIYYKFKNELMYIGLQYDLIILLILTFTFIDNIILTNNNTIISILITFIIDYILFKIRAYFGEKNISKKSMIDSKFLI